MTVETDTPETESASPVDRIAAILASREDKPAPKAQRDEVAEEDEEESSEPGEKEPEESEQDEDEATEDEDQDEQPASAKLEEIEINGKKVKLPADVAAEIKAGTLRQQDYTRKTQEAAELRKAAEAEASQARALRQQYMQGLQLTQQLLQQTAPQPPDQRLLDDDPIEFMRQERAYHAGMQRVGAIQAEQARLAQQFQQEQEAQWQQSLKEAAAKLPDLIPAWKDAKKAASEREALKAYLAENGYTPEEIQSASDPRAIALSRKAWLYDQMIAAKKAAKPTAPKVAAPGPARIPQDQSQVAKARQALKRTGGRDGSSTFLIGRLLEKRGIK